MKVKLLRKVRKRYRINLIESVSPYSSDIHKAIANEAGVPFYEVSDTQDRFSIRTTFYKVKKMML